MKRRARNLSSETPVVAEAFKRQRSAEAQSFREMLLRVQRDKDRRDKAQAAIKETQAAQE